jgi:hypothetical protein
VSTEHLVFLVNAASPSIESLTHSLDHPGYELHCVDSAAEALTTADRTHAAAILIDVPGGVDVSATCDVIRQGRPGMPLVALSGSPQTHHAAVSAGFDLVIDRPINWGALHRWLHTPRGPNGDSLANGPLLGQTPDEVLASTALLAHDLKSPISIVISSLEVLSTLASEEKGADDMSVRLLKGALQAAYRQLYLVSDLLDLSNLELDNYELRRDDVDIAYLLREALDAEDYALAIKGLQISVELPPDPLIVNIDPELMARVFSTLIDNVLKFTVRNDRLIVSAHREADYVVVAFVDTGRPIQPGLERELLRRAPQWERRQAGTRTSVAMGLPFAYAVARAHDGDFSVASDTTTGETTFRLLLPLR